MRAPTFVTAAVVAAALGGAAAAEETLSAADLDGQRGGTETAMELNGSLLQGNDSTLSGSNAGSIGVGSGGRKENGQISTATVTGNHGITSLMQNTGDLVNFNNATSVNVYLR